MTALMLVIAWLMFYLGFYDLIDRVLPKASR